jgi:5-methylcytosine-specific restriction endonuclease McrA
MRFDHLSSHALTAKLGDLLADERQTIVAFVLHLAELERRQLHLELGYASLFVFCTDRLKLSKGAAYRRVTAARLVTRYPVIADYLTDGRLCLTTLAMLRKVLDDSNYVQVLHRAAGRTEEELEDLVAALQPQPAPRDLLQRLPAPQPPQPAPAHSDERSLEVCEVPPKPDDFARIVPPRPPAPAPHPISADQYLLRVTIGHELADDLKKVKALLSHSVPDGNLEAVLHACVRHMIAHCEKRRAGSDEPRPRKVPRPPRGRGIPTPVRREVWKRDDATCAYIAPDGKRCASDQQVQFHHLQPYARNGPPTVDNIQLRCAVHNRHAAEKDFGREFMQRAVRRKASTTTG